MRLLRSTSRRFDRGRTHSVREYRSPTPRTREKVRVVSPERRAEDETGRFLVGKPSRN